MLFIIAMDILHRLFLKASADGVLRQTEPPEIKFQCSFYADNVILFIWPTYQEATTVKTILHIFGEAYGLHTNLAKCSIMPNQIPGFAFDHKEYPEIRLPISG